MKRRIFMCVTQLLSQFIHLNPFLSFRCISVEKLSNLKPWSLLLLGNNLKYRHCCCYFYCNSYSKHERDVWQDKWWPLLNRMKCIYISSSCSIKKPRFFKIITCYQLNEYIKETFLANIEYEEIIKWAFLSFSHELIS